MARKMVCEWGMSENMGPLTYGKKEEQIFLGREIAQHQDYSEDTAVHIDQEVKRIITTNYDKAKALLTQHKNALLQIADALLAREVLDADQVRRIAAGEPLEDLPAAVAASPQEDGTKRPVKERPSIVPALQPLNKPLTQE
jgi:cell division protease FtsH